MKISSSVCHLCQAPGHLLNPIALQVTHFKNLEINDLRNEVGLKKYGEHCWPEEKVSQEGQTCLAEQLLQ